MIGKKKFFIIWLIGLMSGFTIMITGNTLNFWLAKEGVDIKTIGIFALISLPYAINFIWAPIFDMHTIPFLSKAVGYRTSWVIIIQLLLSFVVFLISILSPSDNLLLFGAVGFLISFLSSAQDTVLGALRTEIVDSNKQGQVSGMYVFGYRIGMLLSSSGAIYIAAYISWNLMYELFSVVILAFPVMLLLATGALEEKSGKDINSQIKIFQDIKRNSWFSKFQSLIKNILTPLGTTKYLIIILVFLILYRLPDNFIAMMINPFLISIGYDEFEIATAGKFFGISAAIFGSIIAGFMMKHLDIFKSLMIFGILHGLAHMLFIVQQIYGKNIYLLFLVTGFESITGGMAMTAYIGYIASLCRGKFKATQYSFLTSMMGLSRSILPTFSGYIVASFGWKMFYLFTSIATIPALILILVLQKLRNKTNNE